MTFRKSEMNHDGWGRLNYEIELRAQLAEKLPLLPKRRILFATLLCSEHDSEVQERMSTLVTAREGEYTAQWAGENIHIMRLHIL
jgi:hypothetical protein